MTKATLPGSDYRLVKLSAYDAFVIKRALEDRARITAEDRLWPAP